jgi:hypothetical protein
MRPNPGKKLKNSLGLQNYATFPRSVRYCRILPNIADSCWKLLGKKSSRRRRNPSRKNKNYQTNPFRISIPFSQSTTYDNWRPFNPKNEPIFEPSTGHLNPKLKT